MFLMAAPTQSYSRLNVLQTQWFHNYSGLLYNGTL